MRLAALALAATLAADGPAVPVHLQLMVMLKVLTYDAAFAAHAGNPFVVAVPHGPADEARAEETVAAAKAMDLKSINDRPLRFVSVPVEQLGAVKASAVLLHAGATDELAREALAACARGKVYSLALDEALVKKGALLGVTSAGGRPQVLVNVGTARATGVALGQAVLKVARTVQ